MPEMKELGSLFFGHVRLRRGTAFVHRSPTTEIDYPFRAGPSLIIRIWPGHGIVIGKWTESLDEDTAMKRGLGAREEQIFDQHGTLLPHYGRATDDRWWLYTGAEEERAHLPHPDLRTGYGRGRCDSGDAWFDGEDDW